jgi:small subunit ribosomal protein S17
MDSSQRGNRKLFQGLVVRDKMDKTVMVQVERTVMNPQYKKYVHKRKKFMVHDEKKECHVGDLVEIVETRPVSQNKHFKVNKIIKRGEILAGGVAGNDTK